MESILRTHNDHNRSASIRRWHKHLNWSVHCELVENQFNDAVHAAKAVEYFEALYVSSSPNERQIQLFAGIHPIGSVEVRRDKHGREIGRRFHTEHGAALVFSQAEDGRVAVILYPYKSEKHGLQVDYIIWRIYEDPRDINISEVKKAIEDFLCLVRVSSVLFSECWVDRVRVAYLRFRGERDRSLGTISRLVFGPWLVSLLGLLGSIASIYSLWN